MLNSFEHHRVVLFDCTSRKDSPLNESRVISVVRLLARIEGNGISYEAGVLVVLVVIGQLDDGLIGAVRHSLTRTHTAWQRALVARVGVCDSEVMFVASCRLIQGASRVKVHHIDVHMQRPVFFLHQSRAHVPTERSTLSHARRCTGVRGAQGGISGCNWGWNG